MDVATPAIEKSDNELDGQVAVQPQVEPTAPQHSNSKHNKKGKGKHESKSSEASSGHYHDQTPSHKDKDAAHGQDEKRECVVM
jgi:hypothetical protein